MDLKDIIVIVCAIAGPIGTFAVLNWRVRKIEQEIGTHDTGMRGTLHLHAGTLTRHEADIDNLKKWRPRQK